MKHSKVKLLSELAEVLESLRQKHKKIVLCHGVFDLLHVGHIRYFEHARKSGDILVVTVTPDRYVNKGPQRPAFTDALRAEAVAALDCVDYVAINEWPTAVETIKILKPDFYIKGAEYKSAEKDKTQGIVAEEKAVQSVGGKMVFTEDITFSSSNLIKRYLPVFTKEVSEYLNGFSQRYRPEDVVQYLENAKKLKVLVMGEAIIDEYHYCEAIGKSSKEPMLALRHLSAEKFAGGILAVANHVANFCDEVGLITFLGDRNSEELFVNENLNSRVKRNFLTRTNSPTIVKRRFIENYFFTKMLEVYDMNDNALTAEDNQALCDAIRREAPKYDLVIVVDFGHGMMSQEAIKVVTEQAKFLAVNVQSNAGNLGYHTISRYPRADFLSMAEGEIRLEARDRRGELRPMVLDVTKKLNCDRLIVTRGKFGCLCYSKDEGFAEVPPLASQVIDRMGAGDAFLSVTSLVAMQKAPIEVMGFIGNAAGAQAVATVGHQHFIEKIPLFKQIESLMK